MIRFYRRGFGSVKSNNIMQDYYSALLLRGVLSPDENQAQCIKKLEKLNKYLTISEESRNTSDSLALESSLVSTPRKNLRGLYIHGNVGSGKTFLMDLFFERCHTDKKQRVHFHAFMLNVHKRICDVQRESTVKGGSRKGGVDAITHVARQIAQEARVLCFDEFQVTDVADAMILTRLFDVLWSQGTVLVATSNRKPADLYQNGINRSYFLPFVHSLQANCVVQDMNSDLDYRALVRPIPGSYFTPLGATASSLLWNAFLSSSKDKNEEVCSVSIPVMMGRHLVVEKALVIPSVASSSSATATACYLDFKDLCESDKGAADYLALVQHFKAIYLDNVPRLSVLGHDKSRRFITLIDAIYDAHVRLVWVAESSPALMFRVLSKIEIEQTSDGGGRLSLGTDKKYLYQDGGALDAAASLPSGSAGNEGGYIGAKAGTLDRPGPISHAASDLRSSTITTGWLDYVNYTSISPWFNTYD